MLGCFSSKAAPDSPVAAAPRNEAVQRLITEESELRKSLEASGEALSQTRTELEVSRKRLGKSEEDAQTAHDIHLVITQEIKEEALEIERHEPKPREDLPMETPRRRTGDVSVAAIWVTLVGAARLAGPEGKKDGEGNAAPSEAMLNPYCICRVCGRSGLLFTTSVVQASKDPVWDHRFNLVNSEADSMLEFCIKDSRPGQEDASLGTCRIPCQDLAKLTEAVEERTLLGSGAGPESALRLCAAKAPWQAEIAEAHAAAESVKSEMLALRSQLDETKKLDLHREALVAQHAVYRDRSGVLEEEHTVHQGHAGLLSEEHAVAFDTCQPVVEWLKAMELSMRSAKQENDELRRELQWALEAREDLAREATGENRSSNLYAEAEFLETCFKEQGEFKAHLHAAMNKQQQRLSQANAESMELRAALPPEEAAMLRKQEAVHGSWQHMTPPRGDVTPQLSDSLRALHEFSPIEAKPQDMPSNSLTWGDMSLSPPQSTRPLWTSGVVGKRTIQRSRPTPSSRAPQHIQSPSPWTSVGASRTIARTPLLQVATDDSIAAARPEKPRLFQGRTMQSPPAPPHQPPRRQEGDSSGDLRQRLFAPLAWHTPYEPLLASPGKLRGQEVDAASDEEEEELDGGGMPHSSYWEAPVESFKEREFE